MKKSKLILSIVTFVCLGLGFLLGFVAPEFSKSINFFGDWYITELKIIIGPVIFASIFVNVLRRQKGSSLTLLKTIGLFVAMFIVTFLLTAGVVAIAKPGQGFVLDNPEDLPKEADFGVLAILKNLIPSSLEDVFLGKSIFFVIVI